MHILVLNAGSSSLKFGLYLVMYPGDPPRRDLSVYADADVKGTVDGIGSPDAVLQMSAYPGERIHISGETIEQVVAAIVSKVERAASAVCAKPISIDAIACRVVHGGAEFTKAVRVSPEVVASTRALGRLAPLHNPVDASVIEAAGAAMPHVPIIAVFDTAFHHGLPGRASTYALPWELCEQHGIRRYGFHGISHKYVSGRLLECIGRQPEGTRLIVCHLGNGASVCAIRDGANVDTSMGLTPLEGLVMGTRSGDLDPGVVLYLQRSANMTADQIDDMLNHKSGLLGISGTSGDMRDLEKAMKGGDARARLALDVFAYRVRKYIGAYFVAMGGADAVAFTGGIGEHSAYIRARICEDLDCIGLFLDAESNNRATEPDPARISTKESRVQVWMIPTQEELQMAKEAFALLEDA